MSARELRVEERALGRPVASQRLDEDYEGRPRFHRPDFAVIGQEGTEAVEIELIPRSPEPLEMLVRRWRWTRCVDALTLVCAPGKTTRYTRATLERIGYQDLVREGWVRVVCLDQIPNLARSGGLRKMRRRSSTRGRTMNSLGAPPSEGQPGPWWDR